MQNKYPGQTGFYQGKVRDVYTVGGVMIVETTNRISAFDRILPFEVPHKGAILNQIAAHFMKATEFIIPNCLLAMPTSNTAIWRKTTPFKVEVIVRGYNTGSFYRNYYEEKKDFPWEYTLDLTLRKNEKFPEPLVTPTTKAEAGHDEDISVADIIERKLATKKQWDYISSKALELFAFGQQMADERGLILVDTKYEFGIDENGEIYLIDEVHTPDSSRYWYKDGYEKAFKAGKEPKPLSKEFVRQFLIDNGFQGRDGDTMPTFSIGQQAEIRDRYVELYGVIVGESFENHMKLLPVASDLVQTITSLLVKLRPEIEGPMVSIVMGSKSDLPIMEKAAKVLVEAGVPFELGIVSAHRTPDWLEVFATNVSDTSKVVIAGAGGAAHLPGMVAAYTILPVIGVPVCSASNSLGGQDSMLSILQMPAGVPVATMAINGAENAGLLALQILALNDLKIKEYLKDFKRQLKDKVSTMQNEVNETYYFRMK